MALTRITSAVLGSNAVSAEKLANGSITGRTLANSAIELRHLASDANNVAQVNLVQANLTANNIQITANINAVQGNVNAQRANVNSVSGNVVAVEARRVANIAGAISTVLTSDLTASRALIAGSGGKIEVSTTTSAQLGHLTGVTGAIQTQINAIEARRAANNITTTFADDVIITGNLIINGDTTTANSVNMVVQDRLLMLANSATGAPAGDVGLLFNRGNQGNAAIFYDESAKTFKVSDTKDPATNTSISPVTAGNLDVGILTAATVKFNGADLNTAITDNVATLAGVDTALQARITANSSAFQAEDTALQARIAANTTVAASNDFITFTRLNANINVVSANIDAGVGLVKQVNVATSTGSSNVFHAKVPGTNQRPTHISNVNVFVDGVRQTPDSLTGSNNDFVYTPAAASITITDPSLPSGLTVVIDVLCPRPS